MAVNFVPPSYVDGLPELVSVVVVALSATPGCGGRRVAGLYSESPEYDAVIWSLPGPGRVTVSVAVLLVGVTGRSPSTVVPSEKVTVPVGGGGLASKTSTPTNAVYVSW